MSKNIKELSQLIAKIDDPKLAQDFLSNILTPQELEEVAARLQIFKLLLKGESQRKIAKKLNVSVATVGRGSRELQYGKKE